MRKNNIQKEVDLNTGKSSFWRVDWTSECQFTLAFQSKEEPFREGEQEFLKSHVVTVDILKVRKEYYIFRAGIEDYPASYLQDTAWVSR